MARYLVTGGAGFIGSHLVDALVALGHNVLVLDDLSTGLKAQVNPLATLVQGDVADPARVNQVMLGVDGCYHLAAVASVARGNADWLGTHRSNQTGTVCVLDAARAAGRIPVVYASSAAIYGCQDSSPLHESLVPVPMCAYGADKLGSEMHARVGWSVHALPSVGLRFFNVYGPRQNPCSPYSGVISIFADRMKSNRPIRIDGDGTQTRDFVYVDDVVEHLLASMEMLARDPQAHVLNVCTGRATSVNQLVASISQETGSKSRVSHGPPRDGDMAHALGDPTRAIALLGTLPKTMLVAGLHKLIAP